MRRLIALAFVFAANATQAAAQNPIHDYTEAIDVRFERSQPVVSYVLRVDPQDLSAFSVEMRIRNAPDTLRLAMAAHPEYDDRYWRYVEGMHVTTNGRQVTPVREDSAVWRVVGHGDAVVQYRIRLPVPQESPRAAWRPFLSSTGGLVGGPHAFMYIVGLTLLPSHVRLDVPRAWQTATGMQPTADPRVFFAATVDALVDSPMLVGLFKSWTFSVDGVPHRVAYWPAPGAIPFDTTAFVRGIERIARQAVSLFGRAPYRDYTFLFQDNAYGGLEHRNSVTLGASSASLAEDQSDTMEETAHEFTHTWNLMRIRPEEYGDVSYRIQRTVAGLWWSEGLTIYYADLFLRRARLHPGDSTRLSHLESLISRYLGNPGNSHFSAEQISRVEYNAQPGALGDYDASAHTVGELLGTMLDLAVRDATSNRRSMDDVMRLMLDRFSGARGFAGRDIERTVTDVCGCDVRDLFESNVRGAKPIDVDRYLRLAGLRARVSWTPALGRDGKPATELRFYGRVPSGEKAVKLIVTDPQSAWGRAGLHTGDILVSVNDRTMKTWAELRTVLIAAHIGDTLRFEVARPSGMYRTNVVVTGYNRPEVRIEEIPTATARQRTVRSSWLGSAVAGR